MVGWGENKTVRYSCLLIKSQLRTPENVLPDIILKLSDHKDMLIWNII